MGGGDVPPGAELASTRTGEDEADHASPHDSRIPGRTILTGASLLTLAAAALAAAALALVPARGLLAQGATTIQVDVAADRHAIDPRVYGVTFAEPAQLAALNVPVNRWGGNSTTRHNWKPNGDNRGSDWYFESIPAAGDAGRGVRRLRHEVAGRTAPSRW